MKKIVLLSLIFLLTLISYHEVSAQGVYVSTNPAVLNAQYNLVYPGILPDNPLYFLKALRDNAINFFITDPIKKADYDLMMADKRLAASEVLLDRGKVDLAITTLSKSGNYFYLAIQQVVAAQKSGGDSREVLSKLNDASLKHQQVISQMIEKASKDAKPVLAVSLKRMENFQKSVGQLTSK